MDSFDKIRTIDVYTSTITAVLAVENLEILVVATTDRHLNFYEINSGKLVRRF